MGLKIFYRGRKDVSSANNLGERSRDNGQAKDIYTTIATGLVDMSTRSCPFIVGFIPAIFLENTILIGITSPCDLKIVDAGSNGLQIVDIRRRVDRPAGPHDQARAGPLTPDRKIARRGIDAQSAYERTLLVGLDGLTHRRIRWVICAVGQTVASYAFIILYRFRIARNMQ